MFGYIVTSICERLRFVMKDYSISVQYAVSGCVTRCAHCARFGRKSESLELADVDLILCRLAAAVRDVPGLKIVETPMYELLAHPDPAGINELRTKHLGTVDTAISSSGPAIALRDDWQIQLSRLKELGTETIVVTLHGRDHVHDELVNLRGAYSLTKEALRRIHAVGLRCYVNVYLNAACMPTFSAFGEELRRTDFDALFFGIPVYVPHARLRNYEAIRVSLHQVVPHIETICSLNQGGNELWENLADYTEASLCRQAMEGVEVSEDWFAYYDDSSIIELGCLHNLDIIDGDIGYPMNRYGNLRDEAFTQIIETVVSATESGNYVGINDLRNFFGHSTIPSLPELVSKAGRPASDRIHTHRCSMRLAWLDRLFSDQRML
jgi:hypothetical protein